MYVRLRCISCVVVYVDQFTDAETEAQNNGIILQVVQRTFEVNVWLLRMADRDTREV